MREADTVRGIALKLAAAMERHDSQAVRECYAPDMRFWINTYQVELSGEEHIRLMEKLYFPHYLNPKYVRSRIDLIDGGYVQQHILTARLAADGSDVYMPICAVGRVREGLITRIDEYITMAPGKLPSL